MSVLLETCFKKVLSYAIDLSLCPAISLLSDSGYQVFDVEVLIHLVLNFNLTSSFTQAENIYFYSFTCSHPV